MLKNNLFNLRQWFYRVRHRRQKMAARKDLSIISGLPDGIEMEVLEDVCRRHLNCAVDTVSHVHLSGWKSSGAYRLIVASPNGAEHRLVYKHAYYGEEEIPALQGLPVIPGPPEYDIYRQDGGQLARFLPDVYLAEEVVPGTTYRYLLEDLSAEYRPMKGDEDRLHGSSLLPELHHALAEWSATADTSHLIPYGRAFSEALQQYVCRNLEQYSQQAVSSDLKIILSQWKDIARVHLQPEFFSEPLQPIHSDANFSNIHLHRTDPTRFKVVDWEWAGFGDPYADLSALLKGSLANMQRKAFSRFTQAASGSGSGQYNGQANEKQAFRRFLWSSLERSILDAGFVSAQHMNATHQARVNMETAINRSLSSILYFYRQLS
jgi:hypothetical protein